MAKTWWCNVKRQYKARNYGSCSDLFMTFIKSIWIMAVKQDTCAVRGFVDPGVVSVKSP